MKSDETKRLTYGLIVDEVLPICPDIIADNNAKQPETIMYQHIPLLILKQTQKHIREIAELKTTISELTGRDQRLNQNKTREIKMLR